MVSTRRSSKPPATSGAEEESIATANGSTTTTTTTKTKKVEEKQSSSSSRIEISTKAIRLVMKALGIYLCFIFWGLVQEKVTTKEYAHRNPNGPSGRFTSMIALNASMAMAASIMGFMLHFAIGGKSAPFMTFWRAALSNTCASPLGYLSLKYISFPLMLLTKNMKMVPVMIVGALINKVKYKRYEYASVFLISCGVVLFMMGKGGGGHHSIRGKEAAAVEAVEAHVSSNAAAVLTAILASVSLSELRGFCLALLNLIVDGFTNAEQDRINAKHGVSPYYMMAMVNTWSLMFASTFLIGDLCVRGQASELATLISFLQNYPAVTTDLLAFSFSNALGQVFIFSIISEFGALVCVTVTVTRKMITLFLSIIVHKHSVHSVQWLGVISVCLGLSLKIIYSNRIHGGKKKDDGQKKKAP